MEIDPQALPGGQAQFRVVVSDGYAYDPEEGEIPPERLRWQDKAGTSLGQGGTLRLEGLPSGAHRIVLLAPDAAGQNGRVEVTITVGSERTSEPDTFPYGGGILAGLAVIGGLVGIIVGLAWRKRLEPALAALVAKAAGIREQVQAGRLRPAQGISVQGQDRRGQHWSLDPLRGTWYRWTGSAWQQVAPPRGGRRWGWLIGGLVVLVMGVVVGAVVLL